MPDIMQCAICRSEEATHAELVMHLSDVHSVETPACPGCDRPMILKSGRFGTFWACVNFPEDRTTLPFEPAIPLDEGQRAEPTNVPNIAEPEITVPKNRRRQPRRTQHNSSQSSLRRSASTMRFFLDNLGIPGLYSKVSVEDWYWRPSFKGSKCSLADLRLAFVDLSNASEAWLKAPYPSDEWDRLWEQIQELRGKLPDAYMPWLLSGKPLYVRFYWILCRAGLEQLTSIIRWKGYKYVDWVDDWYYAIAQEFNDWHWHLQEKYEAIQRAEDRANLESRERQRGREALLRQWLSVRGFGLSNAEFWRLRGRISG